jgi:hypothetical protein
MAAVASSPRLSATSLEAPRLAHYLAVGLIAGAIIALQISVMRVFAVGSWSHFGSLVVSLAMLGFSLSSVVIFAGKDWFGRHWQGAASIALMIADRDIDCQQAIEWAFQQLMENVMAAGGVRSAARLIERIYRRRHALNKSYAPHAPALRTLEPDCRKGKGGRSPRWQ